MRYFLWATWYAVSIFALGLIGYYFLAVRWEIISGELYLVLNAAVALACALFYWFTERADDARVERDLERRIRRRQERHFTSPR